MCNCWHIGRVYSDMTTPLSLSSAPLAHKIFITLSSASLRAMSLLDHRFISKCCMCACDLSVLHCAHRAQVSRVIIQYENKAAAVDYLAAPSLRWWWGPWVVPHIHNEGQHRGRRAITLTDRLCIIHWPLFTEPLFMGKHAPRRWNTPGVVYYRWYRVSGPRGGSVKCRVISYKRRKLCCVALKSCCMESMQIKCCAKKILLWVLFFLFFLLCGDYADFTLCSMLCCYSCWSAAKKQAEFD